MLLEHARISVAHPSPLRPNESHFCCGLCRKGKEIGFCMNFLLFQCRMQLCHISPTPNALERMGPMFFFQKNSRGAWLSCRSGCPATAARLCSIYFRRKNNFNAASANTSNGCARLLATGTRWGKEAGSLFFSGKHGDPLWQMGSGSVKKQNGLHLCRQHAHPPRRPTGRAATWAG